MFFRFLFLKALGRQLAMFVAISQRTGAIKERGVKPLSVSECADARCGAEGSEGCRHDGCDGLEDEFPDVFLVVHITMGF